MTPENLDALFGKYSNKGVLIDTNLFLLFLVGLANRNRVGDFKPLRNRGYSIEDFKLLARIISKFGKIGTTPHILTEVSNHSDKLKGEDKRKFCAIIRDLIGNWEERCPESAELVKQDHFIKLGLTDTAISEVAAGDFLVLTDDAELMGHLQKRNVDVFNLNHIRLLAEA